MNVQGEDMKDDFACLKRRRVKGHRKKEKKKRRNKIFKASKEKCSRQTSGQHPRMSRARRYLLHVRSGWNVSLRRYRRWVVIQKSD